jgi:BlaI family penicillinase repressor
MAYPRFGRVQLRIMQVLWHKGKTNAREITEALNQEAPIAHSTVQTLLRKLENKGAVSHTLDERTFVYYPLVPAIKAAKDVSKEMIERMFEGSAAELVCHLIKQEQISKTEMEEIEQLLQEKKTT